MAWGKSGSTTASTTVNSLDSPTYTGSIFQQILYHDFAGTGGNMESLKFNDSGTATVYAFRGSRDGGTDSTEVNQNNIQTNDSAFGESFAVIYVCSVTGEEKLVIGNEYDGNTTVGAPYINRHEFVGKFVPATDAPITKIALDSVDGNRTYISGSNITILGSDFTNSPLPTNVQVGSRFEETDTRKMYHYTYDWFLEGTTIPPWSFTDDLSSSTPWTSVGSGITVTGGEISMAGVAASGSNYLWRSLSHTLSDTLWTMEFDYKSTGQSGGSVFFPFGVKSSVSPLSPNSGDSLRLRDDTDNAYLGTLSATVGGADSGSTASIAWTEGSFYYPRIGRTSSTTMKYQLFSDSARTSQVGSTLTATISSSITGLDTLVCGGGDGGGGTSTGKISNIYISESDLFT